MKRITIRTVSKRFILDRRKDMGALGHIVSLFSRTAEPRKTIQVADAISLEAESGESVGIIGRNGSGKSTLLRLIAGIYEADAGVIKTEGKLIYLSGYGQGLQPKLTMRDNIYLIGAIMGLTRAEIRGRFDEIVDFCGLREFLDAKVYQFSSGMVTRLNFSVTIHCVAHHKPEILLLDEVLGAGGDIDFQRSALAKMEELMQGGATVILVSHNLEMIEKYCSRALWIEQGKIVRTGSPQEVVAAYTHEHQNSLRR